MPQPLSADLGLLGFVKGAQLFRGVEEAHHKTLFEPATVLEVEAGEAITSQGLRDDRLFLVVEGKVSICSEDGEGLYEFTTLERQGVFGEAAVLTESNQSWTAVAKVTTKIAIFPGQAIRAVAQQSEKLGKRLAALMAARSRSAEEAFGG